MTRQRIALLYLGTLAVLLLATWLVLRETDVTRGLIVRRLATHVQRDRFTLQSAGFDFGFGEARLRGLSLNTPPDAPGQLALDAARVDVGIGTHPLRAPGALRYVRARGVSIDVDLVRGRLPDLAGLLEPPPERPAADPLRPAVELRDATLRLRLDPAHDPLELRVEKLELLPHADAPHRYALTLRADLPGVAELVVDGELDLDSGALRLAGNATGPRRLELSRLRSVAPELAATLDELAVRGELTGLEVTAEGRIDGGAGSDPLDALRVDAVATLAGLDLGGPRVPYPLHDAAGEVQFTWDGARGAELRAEVRESNADGTLTARGAGRFPRDGAPHFEVHAVGDDVRVRPAIGRAIQDIEPAREAWEAFQPSGGVFDLRAHYRSAQADADEVFDLELRFRAGTGRYVGYVDDATGTRRWGFPYPLQDARGTVRVRDDVVHIEDCSSRIGSDRVQISGTVDTRGDGPPSVRLHVDGRRVPFDAAVRDALATLHPPSARVWDDCAPAGEAALSVDIDLGPRAARPGVWVTIRPLLAAATYAAFPLRVEDLEGRIDIGPQAVELELRGLRRAAPTDVAVRGRFALEDAAAASGDRHDAELLVRANDLATDEELLAALSDLSPDIDTAIDELGFSGAGDVEVVMWRPTADDAFTFDARLDLREGRAELDRLGVPFADLTGTVFVQGDDARAMLEIADVAGRVLQRGDHVPASLFLHGFVASGPGGPRRDLTALIEGLHLDDGIGTAVDRAGAFDFANWQLLEPAGFVDLSWHSTASPAATGGAAESDLQDAGADLHQEVNIQLRDVRSTAPFLPGPAEELTGAVRILDGIAEIRDVQGTMRGATFVCPQGRVVHSDGVTRFRAEVQSSRFPVDDHIANLLSGPLRQTYLDRRLRGHVQIDGLRIEVALPDDADTFASVLRGTVQAQDVSMRLGAQIDDLNGLWTIEGARFGPGLGEVSGRVQNGTAELFGHRLTNLTADFAIDADDVVFRELDARLHRGRLRGMSSTGNDLYYRFAPPGELSLDLRWEDASLQGLLPGTDLRGNLAARVHLERLVGGDFGTARGGGSVAIRGGNLGEDPIFRSIYAYLEKPRRPVFRDLAANLQLTDRALQITDLEVTSPQAEVRGRGHIGFDGYLDIALQLPDFFGRDNDWMLLPWVVRTTLNQLLEARARGYLRAPRVDVYGPGESAEGRIPLRPIPPFDADR